MNKAENHIYDNILDCRYIEILKEALRIQAKQIFQEIDLLAHKGVCFEFNEDSYTKLKEKYICEEDERKKD